MVETPNEGPSNEDLIDGLASEEGDIFGDLNNLFNGESPPDTDKDPADPKSKEGETDKQTATTEGEEEEEGSEETSTDDLFTKEEDDEAEWDGESPLHKHPRFKKVITQRDEERTARESVEKQLDKVKSTQTAFLEHYERFEAPENQLKEDVRLVEAIERLQEHPAVSQALEVISQFYNKGKVEDNMTEEKTATEDPRVEQLMLQQVGTQVRGVLGNSQIDPQFHRVIENHVLDTVDVSADVSGVQIKDAIRDFIEDSGFSQDMLVGKTQKQATKSPATGKSKSASRASGTKGKEATETPKTEFDEITDPEELKAALRGKLSGLFQE